MKTLALAIFALVVPAPMTVQAQDRQPDQARCEAVEVAVTEALKALAFGNARRSLETSAPRASVAAGEDTVLAISIQTRISQMNAMGCPPYTGPVGPDAYGAAATRCIEAIRASPGTGQKPECERATWQPTLGAL